MKKYTLFLAIAALLLAGCAKEPVAPDGGAITVEATLGAATKVSAGGDAFAAGDQIAVYAWLGGATTNPTTRVVDGVVNTFDGTAWTPASPMRWQATDAPHYFLGVYPASKAPGSDFTAVPYTMTGSAAADDLLLATTPAGVTNTGVAVQLAFHHVMARLDVNLRFRNEWASVPTADHVSVSVEAKRSATVNYLTETVTASGTAAPVALAPATAATGYALGYSSLQVPQDGVRKITVKIDDFEYEFASTTDIPLTGGKYTTLNLVLGKEKIELDGISITDWTTEAVAESGAELDMLSTPLTIEAAVAGAVVSFDIQTDIATNPVLYRVWDGTSWTVWLTYPDNQVITLPNVGDKIQFKAETTNARYSDFATDKYSTFQFSEDCYVYGNIMSLIKGSGFSTETALTGDDAFMCLFSYSTHLRSHPEKPLLLPATTLTDSCYSRMFEGCAGLTSAPVLPATVLADSCYEFMFYLCSNLVHAPDLPAIVLSDGCYYGMFAGCVSLVSAPELPAMTLALECYNAMFSSCASLTTAPALPALELSMNCYCRMFFGCTHLTVAPELPAMVMSTGCYQDMFDSCTSLTAAPVLPAAVLAKNCYSGMFLHCVQLSSVTCLAEKINASHCTMGWLNGAGTSVTGTKTFTALASTPWTTGNDGIPTGWTRQEGHVYVDMGEVTIRGIQKHLKWATCNVGAAQPWDAGNYFSWGETAPKTAYTTANYLWSGGYSYLTLRPEDDAARVNWGAGWRIPTAEEWTALMDTAVFDWAWTNNYNTTGTQGYIVTRKAGTGSCAGNSIFLPETGCYTDSDFYPFEGRYWASTQNGDFSYKAIVLSFDGYLIGINDGNARAGVAVRAVYD